MFKRLILFFLVGFDYNVKFFYSVIIDIFRYRRSRCYLSCDCFEDNENFRICGLERNDFILRKINLNNINVVGVLLNIFGDFEVFGEKMNYVSNNFCFFFF